ncbi:MAG: hypothetical protein SCALA702_33730 [Melioribacteraceae bacterium]|nr:MAG: hypothetical protein SCALA702_33730 [Melioribacteraceae bacterium]
MKLLIGGDYLPDNNIFTDPEFPTKYFGEVIPLIEESDLAIFNLETVIEAKGDKIVKTGVSFNSTSASLKLFERPPVLLALANNHILDYGYDGLSSTIQNLDSRGIKHIGAALNEGDATQPYIYEKSGIRLGVLNYCEHEFSTCDQFDGFGANGYSDQKAFYHISELKEKCNKIIVIYHGNLEYTTYPSPEMKKRMRYLADLGANAIICHHSHYYSGYEVYAETPIFYGLGNFYAESKAVREIEYHTGLLVELDVKEKVTFKLIPYRQNYGAPGVKMLGPADSEELLNKINIINETIVDEEKLKNEWMKFIINKKSKYYYILKQQNKLVYQLVKRGVLKQSEISNDILPFLLNIIRNESHREAVISLLEYELNRDKNKR